ncbi:MAG: ATP-binding protein [Actinomycetota bacterium]|nr:ATP-binding protein [Actinomycetota bacterium]
MTLVFTAVMALLLCAVGLFLYLRLGVTLDASVDRGLRSRAGDVSALIQQADSGLAQSGRSPLTQQGEGLAQVLDARGRIVDAPPPLRSHPLLSPAEVARAERRTVVLEHASSPVEPGRIRLLATPVRAQDRNLVVVVATPLDANTEARSELGSLLLIGGPVALLIASLVGYGAAAQALRPVESMRRRAGEIQAARPGQRLPVPPSRDEVARLGETLNDMLARLEDAFARERRFVSDASHELRTPLAVLKAELELALRDALTVEEFRASVRSAAEETDRLTLLAEDLLVIARADQGRLPIRAETLDVGDILETVAQRFARRAGDARAQMSVEVPAGLTVQADRLRLEQALSNLVDNSLRHGTGPVALSAIALDGHIELHVRDHGPAFPPEFLQTAFERFTRADSGREGPGTGLGLAIVQAIARAHGGEARARNAHGTGADVWLELPLEPH